MVLLHHGVCNQAGGICGDAMVVPDALQWTLEQFKGDKLPAMIERADYPTIAAATDRNLVATKLEKEVEPKAMAMRAAHTK